MNIKYSDVLTLSDKKQYIVAGMTNYNNYDYLFLIDIHDNKNVKFVWLKENSVVVLDNKLDCKLIEALLPLFVNNAKEFLEENIEE